VEPERNLTEVVTEPEVLAVVEMLELPGQMEPLTPVAVVEEAHPQPRA
jgi:hypothetical protein